MKSVTLHEIAKELSLLRRDKSDIYIPDYILLGRECVAEMVTRGFMPISSVALDIDQNTNSAKLSDDYLQYIRVGICINGRIIELDYDSTMCVREKQDNFCYTNGCSSTAAVAGKNYRIENTGEVSIVVTYTSDILDVNGESITISTSEPVQIICSRTVPVFQDGASYTIVEVGACGTDSDTVNISYPIPEYTPEAQFENDCACLRGGGIPVGYNSYYYWDNIYHDGNLLRPIYTLPAYKSPGFFKIQNGRIYLKSVCSSGQVVIQYKSTGVSDCGQTEIPYDMKDVVKHYVLWKSEFFDRNANGVKVRLYEEEYRRKKDLMTMQKVMSGVLDMLKVEMQHTFMANLGR